MDLDFNRLAAKRRTHFKENRLGVAPQKQDVRFRRAKACLERETPDYETALVLYDKIDDFDHPEFLELMGDIFSDENSPVYNLEEAKTFYKGAYAFNPEVEGQKSTARKLLKAYKALNISKQTDLYQLHQEQVVFDCVLFLCGHSEEPELFQVEDSVVKAPYIIATYAGAGKGMPQDHEAAVQMYEAYVNNVDRGYLAEAYQNLAIRRAFGLGVDADIHKAATIAKTGFFMLEGQNKQQLKHHAQLLENLAKNAYTYDYLEQYAPRIAQGAWAFFDLVRTSGIPNDAIELIAALAYQEDWADKENWRSIYHQAEHKYGSGPSRISYSGLSPAVSEFNPEMLNREKDRLLITPFRLKLYQYFKDKGWGFPPVDQEERLNFSNKLVSKVPPDYESALILFDSKEDGEHSNWLLNVGYIYNQHINNPFFDPVKSFDYYYKASELGNSAASYNLALKYLSGKETEIDLDAAIYWFNRSKEQGSLNAEYQILALSINQDKRYYDPNESQFRKSLYEKIMNLADKGDFYALHKAANIFAAGRECRKTDSKVIELYDIAINRPHSSHEQDTKYGMVWCYALRSYLGIGTKVDIKKCFALLNEIPEKSNSIYITQLLSEDVKKLKDIIENEKGKPESYGRLKSFIQDMYQTPYRLTINTASNEMLDVFWCVNKLAENEEWLERYQWQDFLREVQAKLMGIEYSDVLKSTLFEGPRYNPQASNGLPVLGVWERPSEDERNVEKSFLEKGSYVPEAGIVKFKGVSLNKEGTLTFDFTKASDRPAYLLAEDFEVALTLAFGDPKGVSRPYLSLENPNRHGIHDKYAAFKFKEWNPAWLGYTDLGRTLYMTDQLIGRFCWLPREFDIGSPDITFSPQAADFAYNLVEDIALTGGRSGEGAYSRVMLVPEHITWKPETNKDGFLTISVPEVQMRIDGDYIIQGESKDKDLHRAKNDDFYQQGRTVNKLTRRYNDIAAMMPAFARAQELMALLHATRTMREIMDHNDMSLDSAYLKRIRERHSYYESLPPLPLHEQLCVPLPLEHKRI